MSEIVTWKDAQLKKPRIPDAIDFTCSIETVYKNKAISLLGFLELSTPPRNTAELLIPTETWPDLRYYGFFTPEEMKPAVFISLWNLSAMEKFGLVDDALQSMRMWQYNDWFGYTFFKSLIKKGKSTTPYGPYKQNWVAPGDYGETGKVYFSYVGRDAKVNQEIPEEIRATKAANKFTKATKLTINPITLEKLTVSIEMPKRKKPKRLKALLD